MTYRRFRVPLASLASCVVAQESGGPPSPYVVQQPSFWRMRLGGLMVTVVSDGTAVRDATTLVNNLAAGEVERLAAISHRGTSMELSINAFVVDSGTNVVLIDTGAGDLFKPEAGLLVQSLRAAGYDPDRVSAVILTHIHADHSGGLLLDGKRVFKNALVYVPERDFDFFLDPEEGRRAPDRIKHVFAQAEKCLKPYIDAGDVRKFGWNVDVVPFIHSFAAPGHTPGHTHLHIESRGEKLVVLGDTVHVAEVQFPEPGATVTYDVRPEEAAAQRRQAFQSASDIGYWVAFDHVSFPGIGHIRRDGLGFSWIPMPYTLRH